jgi:CCR4-NOT transcription complex subunit 1
MADVCSGDNSTNFLFKLIDFSQNIKDFVQPLTQTDAHYFSISLSLLAIKREFLRLENWVEDRLQNGGVNWVNEFLFYVQKNFLDIVKGPPPKRAPDDVLERSQLSKNVLANVFGNYLLSDKAVTILGKPAVEKVRQFYHLIQQVLPDLSQISQTDTESKANDILQKYYDGGCTIDDLVKKAQDLKTSNGNREQEILACIIINIIDEFRFYSNFPEKELFLTSEIYGKFIVNRLIDGRTHTVFLKAISDSLEKEGKMFQFGLKALQHFIMRMDLGIPNDFYKILFANEKLRKHHFRMLSELRKALAEVDKEKIIDPEHLRIVAKNLEADNKLKEQAEEEEAQQNAARQAQGKPKQPERTLHDMLIGTFESMEPIDGVPEATKQRLIRLLNCIDDKKFDDNKSEFLELIKDKNTINWFCKCLVYKRVPAEPVIQTTYRKLIYRTPNDDLYKLIYKYTISMINDVINFVSVRETLSAEDKNTARTCGSWLGQITLACNKPILLADLDLKKRIYESLENKTLSNIVHIVGSFLKVMERSKLFNVSVPFINSLLDVLREILHSPNIVHNTKIVIEVLFTDLKIADTSLHNFGYIAKRRNLDSKKGLTFNTKSLAEMIASNSRIVQELGLEGKMHVDLKNIVVQATHCAIQDVLKRVLDRSVKVALETTRELVLRDFAMEASEKRILECARNMVQNLSWNLALVSSRDPLKDRFEFHLTRLLMFMSDCDEVVRKQIWENVSSKYFEQVCDIVKSKVIENAQEELMKDEQLNWHLEARRKALNAGQVYTSNYVLRVRAELPPALTSLEAVNDLDKIEIYSSKYTPSNFHDSQNPPAFLNQILNDSFEVTKNGDEVKVNEIVQNIEAQFDTPNVDDKIKQMHSLFTSLVKALDGLKNADTVLPRLTEATLKKMFAAPLSLETVRYYTDILILYRNNFPRLPLFLTTWVIRNEDTTFVQPEVLKLFLKNYLIDAREFDDRISELMTPQNSKAFTCAVVVLKNVVIEEKIFSIYSFPKVVAKIVKLAQEDAIKSSTLENSVFVQNLVQFVTNENAINQLKLNLSNLEPEYNKLFIDMKEDFATLNEPIFALASAAFAVFQGAPTTAELEGLYAKHQDVQREERQLLTYFSYLYEVVINQMAPEAVPGANVFEDVTAPNYSAIDNLTAYIVVTLEQSAEPEVMFEKVVTSFIMVLTKKHFCEDPTKFNQRPFFRILFNIIQEVHKPSFKLAALVASFDVNILQTIHILQPLKYPSFAFAWLQLIYNPTLMEAVLKDSLKGRLRPLHPPAAGPDDVRAPRVHVRRGPRGGDGVVLHGGAAAAAGADHQPPQLHLRQQLRHPGGDRPPVHPVPQHDPVGLPPGPEESRTPSRSPTRTTRTRRSTRACRPSTPRSSTRCRRRASRTTSSTSSRPRTRRRSTRSSTPCTSPTTRGTARSTRPSWRASWCTCRGTSTRVT